MLDICYKLRDLANAGVIGSHVPFKFTVLTTAQARKITTVEVIEQL